MSQPGARAQAVELAKQLAGSHYECEDSWYSCPKSAEGCANSGQGDECTCGYDNRVDLIAQAIQAAVEAERERIAKMLDAEADRQEADWDAFLADPTNRGKHATSLHAIPRGYAKAIRQEGDPS